MDMNDDYTIPSDDYRFKSDDYFFAVKPITHNLLESDDYPLAHDD